MIRSPLRVLAALAAIVVLTVYAIIAWTGVGTVPISFSQDSEKLSSVTWAGRVAEDGRVAVEITYDFTDDEPLSMDIRLPDRARFLQVNGTPVPADIGKYAEDITVSRQVVVSYEIIDAVTRYSDGALLQLAATDGTSIDSDQGIFVCPYCYIDGVDYGETAVYGRLTVEGGTVEHLDFLGMSSIRAADDAEGTRFVGVQDTGVSMVATLSADAASDVVRRDGTVADAWEATKARFESAGQTFQSPQSGDGDSVVLPLVLTFLAVGLSCWLVVSFRRPRRGSPS